LKAAACNDKTGWVNPVRPVLFLLSKKEQALEEFACHIFEHALGGASIE